MSDLISRRSALEALTVTEEMETADLLWLLTTRINDLPTIEPSLVGTEMPLPEPKRGGVKGLPYQKIVPKMPPCKEPKRGRWIEDGHYERCSECREVVDELYNYCPCCGAKMESE